MDNHIDILNEIIEIYVRKIEEKGFADAGNNGSYHCNDTPSRNSAHWIITFAYEYENTHNSKYLKIINLLAEYLLLQQKKTKNGTILCMSSPGFDDINGLIGQAWIIEGLVSAYRVTKDNRYIQAAKCMFKSQIYDLEKHYWKRVDTNNNVLGYDIAFNHQLWFAVSGAMVNKYDRDNDITFYVNDFVDNLNEHFLIKNNGRICHFGDLKPKKGKKKIIKELLISLLPHSIWKHNPDKLRVEVYENSYQLFNLYGFALLYNNGYEDHPFFKTDRFTKALDYALDIDYLNYTFNVKQYNSGPVLADVRNSIAKFSYGYNSPAFEYGYVVETFKNNADTEKVIELLNIQNNLCYSEETGMYSRNTDDANTLTARVYELTRYLEKIKQ